MLGKFCLSLSSPMLLSACSPSYWQWTKLPSFSLCVAAFPFIGSTGHLYPFAAVGCRFPCASAIDPIKGNTVFVTHGTKLLFHPSSYCSSYIAKLFNPSIIATTRRTQSLPIVMIEYVVCFDGSLGPLNITYNFWENHRPSTYKRFHHFPPEGGTHITVEKLPRHIQNAKVKHSYNLRPGVTVLMNYSTFSWMVFM